MKTRKFLGNFAFAILICTISPTNAIQDLAYGDPGICGLSNCHGTDFTCVTNPPVVCNEMYSVGDFCRNFALCKMVRGKCELVKGKRLQKCLDCLKGCGNKDPILDFKCDTKCRKNFGAD